MVMDVGNITRTVDDASFHGMDTLACSLHCLWSSAITLCCTHWYVPLVRVHLFGVATKQMFEDTGVKSTHGVL